MYKIAQLDNNVEEIGNLDPPDFGTSSNHERLEPVDQSQDHFNPSISHSIVYEEGDCEHNETQGHAKPFSISHTNKYEEGNLENEAHDHVQPSGSQTIVYEEEGCAEPSTYHTSVCEHRNLEHKAQDYVKHSESHTTTLYDQGDIEAGNHIPPIQTGHVLSWSEVNMELKSNKNKGKHVLQNINGSLLQGQLTGIMGHSGAGKSTLLNILAGNIHSTREVSVTHDIRLDGEKVSPSDINIRRKIAFVAQKDVLLLTATPREAIRFSARLRLDRNVSDENIEILTTRILEELRLTRVADSKIAQLSGGEMRRTSLGIELVVRPKIVLLDEVTSGLDSYNATQVLDVLKNVSLGGASVMFTLHQPNSQMFAAIDNLILMHHGRCMYQGAVRDIPHYFAERGHAVPQNYNPADWILMVSEGISSTDQLQKLGFFDNFPGEKSRMKTCQLLIDSNSKSSSALNSKSLMGTNKNRVSIWREVWLLLKRGFNHALRDSKLLMLRFAIIGIGAAIIATVFAGACARVFESVLDFQSHLGAVFFLCMTGTIITQVILLEFIDERPVIMREFSTDHYRMASYTISRLIIDGISVFLQVLFFFVIIYWTVGLQGRFWYLLLCFYSFAMAGASLAVFLGSYTKDPRDSKELIPMLLLPQLLFSGFFVSLSSIPIWLQWLQWVVPLTYTFRLVIGEEFSFCSPCDPDPLGIEMVCYNYLEEQEATPEFRLQYWGTLIGMILFLRIISLFFLRRKTQ